MSARIAQIRKRMQVRRMLAGGIGPRGRRDYQPEGDASDELEQSRIHWMIS
jgi:hypothetical protein